MDLFLSICGHVLTFFGALVAVIGDTWKSEAKGIRKLTRTGWIASIIASLGIALSIYNSVEENKTHRVYEEIALRDIVRGWRQVASPLTLANWEATGVKGDISISSLKALLTEGSLAKLDKVDFSRPTQVPQYEGRPLGQLFCEMSRSGMAIMEGAVRNNTTVVSREIATKVERLRQGPVFGEFLAFGCGTTLDGKPDLTRFKGMFDRELMRAYVRELISLGEELPDPGRLADKAKKNQTSDGRIISDKKTD